MKAPGARGDWPRSPRTAWLLGLAAGSIGTWLLLRFWAYGAAIYALLAAVLVLRGPRAAFGGALLLSTGLWFTYGHFEMLARCAAANTASGSCTVIDAGGTAIPALTFVLVGAGLSAYALWRH